MIINFGSINIDHVYRVNRMPVPGETVTARSYEKFLGGKGINQSVAIARAGGSLIHVGAVGPDGDWALDQIEQLGVATDHVTRLGDATGHAIIYVDDAGENQIVVEGGANRQLTERMVEASLAEARPDQDWVLLQNETNLAGYIAQQAKSAGFRIAYAAAPFAAETTLDLIDKIDLLAVNEGEAAALAAELGTEPDRIPVPNLLVTKGASGAEFIAEGERLAQPSFAVMAVDTTGAGDTFLGSFLAGYTDHEEAASALEYAAAASALQVTRTGAATAIPRHDEVLTFMQGTNMHG